MVGPGVGVMAEEVEGMGVVKVGVLDPLEAGMVRVVLLVQVHKVSPSSWQEWEGELDGIQGG